MIGVDKEKNTKFTNNIDFFLCDLNRELPDLDYNKFDYILFLDVIEHLENPENFLDRLYDKVSDNEKIEILISTPNISFFIMRFMLLLGFFNYGKRGILDKTHTRLFTFQSFRKIIKDSNFEIIEIIGIPAPIPLIVGENLISNIFININNIAIKIWKSFFSYQILCKIKPNKSLKLLLKKAEIKK